VEENYATPAPGSESVKKTESEDPEGDGDDEAEDPTPFHLAPIATAPDNEMVATKTNPSLHSGLTRTSTAAYTRARFDVEQALAAERTKSVVIAPTKTIEGVILVDWYTTDDPA
jgi:MFS transporter, DHA1 family, multidrug resistance protein